MKGAGIRCDPSAYTQQHMKFDCDITQLTQAVMNVSRIIPNKSSVPILEGIYIQATASSILLTGYNSESGITTNLPATIEQEGEIVLPAHLFLDMLRKMAGAQVSIEVGEKHLTHIASGHTHFTILGMPAEEYPELPQIETESGLKIPQNTLKSMIDQTLFAVAVNDTKPVHTGSLFHLHDGLLSVVSVDGYRLAMRVEPIEEGDTRSFVIPGKTLSEISKLLDEHTENPAVVQIAKRHILFRLGNYCVISRLLEGEFLDYQQSIPKGHQTLVRVSRRLLIESVERVSLLISDRLRSPVCITFDNHTMKMSCSTALGRSYDEIECYIDGPPIEMGFNNRYLLDALKATDCDEVYLAINSALSPVKVLPLKGENFLFLVLPVRLKNET